MLNLETFGLFAIMTKVKILLQATKDSVSYCRCNKEEEAAVRAKSLLSI